MNRTTEKIIGFSGIGISILFFALTVHMTMIINLEGTFLRFSMGIFLLSIPAIFGVLTLIIGIMFLVPKISIESDWQKGEHVILR